MRDWRPGFVEPGKVTGLDSSEQQAGGTEEGVPGFGRVHGVLAAVMLCMGLFLRCAQLTELEFDIDESCSVLYATAPEGVLASLSRDANAPGYFLALKAWMAVFSRSETSIRGFSVFLGMLVVLLIPLCMRAWEFTWQAALWAMSLAAFSPLQIYYSQNARGYILVNLLVVLLLWSFALAVKGGRWRDWILFGIVQLAGLYTHNLFLPVAVGFWVGGFFLGLGKRDFLKWGVVQFVVLDLYWPWISRLNVAENTLPGLEWIVSYWEATPPALAILRSLEVFGIGGRMPGYFRDLSGSPITPIRWLSVGFFILAGLSLIASRLRRGEVSEGRSGRLLFLLTVMLVPLFFQFGFSMWQYPIYLVGRYDCIVHPAYILLMGGALETMQVALGRWRSGARFLPAVVLGVLVVYALIPRFRPLPDWHPSEVNPTRYRGGIIERHGREDDLILCLGIEGAKLMYERMRLGLPNEVRTFPESTMEHIGWFNARVAFGSEDVVRRDARELADLFRADPPCHRGVWVVMDPESRRVLIRENRPVNAFTVSAGILVKELTDAGLRAEKLEELRNSDGEPIGMVYLRLPD